jgi:hypothetical protein
MSMRMSKHDQKGTYNVCFKDRCTIFFHKGILRGPISSIRYMNEGPISIHKNF